MCIASLKSLLLLLERLRKRADTDTVMDMITVSVHVLRVLDFVSQTKRMFHLRALAFIMSVFLTNMTRRDPVFYKLHFLIVLLAKYDSCGYASHEHTKSVDVSVHVSVSVSLRNLSTIKARYNYTTLHIPVHLME